MIQKTQLLFPEGAVLEVVLNNYTRGDIVKIDTVAFIVETISHDVARISASGEQDFRQIWSSIVVTTIKLVKP